MTDAGVRGLDPSSLHVDQLVGLVADRQDGVVLREQLEALGLGRGAIAHRRKRGLLRPLHKGVYLWGALTPTPAAQARAAVLAAGAESLVSHVWALSLWGLRPAVDGPVDVTVVGRRARAAGIRGHESASLHPADMRLLRGIPVTAPARSLLDCAAQLPPGALADAVEQAQIKRLVTKQDIAGAIGRAPRRPGANALRALVDQSGITRSRAERIVRSLVREARLPQPEFNAIAEGFEVDALWRRERVVLEFDSYAFHATRQAFERDRRKTAALTRNRYVVLRTTWNELTHQSHALIARTAEALARSAALIY